ncbi:MAG: Hsp20 family protein [Chloroflexota bacterium]|nr:Hsp20 family protein [Chloroflexota bacterium]
MSERILYQHMGIGRLRLAREGQWASGGTHFQPPTDVYETDDLVVVVVEVAGLLEGEYEVTLSEQDRVLTVVGRRQSPEPLAGKVTYYRLEIPFGTFLARVELPGAVTKAEEAEAVYADGFLVITLQKPKPRQVPVDTVDSEDSA